MGIGEGLGLELIEQGLGYGVADSDKEQWATTLLTKVGW